jgi:hypothetical protein
MKKIAGLFIVFGFVFATPVLKLHAQKPFEGNISLTGTAAGQSMDAVAHVKGNHIEIDAGSTIMGQTKRYVDTRLQKIITVMGSHGMETNYDNDTSNVDLTTTGNHKKIAGYDAQEYTTTSKNGKKTTYWAAAGVPKDIADAIEAVLFSAAPPKARRGANLLLGRGFAVLSAEIEFSVMGRDITSTGEFVKADPQSLDDALFKIPSDLSMVPLTEKMLPQDD